MRGFWDYLAFKAVRVLWVIAERIPLRVLRGLLEGLGRWSYRLNFRWGDRVRENLHLAFPDWEEDRVDEAAASAIAYWGRLAAETVHARTLTEETPEQELVRFREAIQSQRERGKGLLLLTAHFGNFELLGRLCARSGLPLATFFRAFRNPYFDRFFLEDRRSMNLQLLGRGAGVRDALRLLAKGGVVAVLLDQNQRPGHGVFVNMFGHPACTSTVLARLSLSSGAPVLPAFALWKGDRTVPLFGEVIEPRGPDSPAHGATDRNEQVLALTARYTAEIERVVRAYPEQWNWVHRRWKTQPGSLHDATNPTADRIAAA